MCPSPSENSLWAVFTQLLPLEQPEGGNWDLLGVGSPLLSSAWSVVTQRNDNPSVNPRLLIVALMSRRQAGQGG